jgi:hypothetical protein
VEEVGREGGRERRAGRWRTKKVALVQERRPVKTAVRVVECMVVVLVLVVVVEWYFESSLPGCFIYLPSSPVYGPVAAVSNLTLWVAPTAGCSSKVFFSMADKQ